MYNPFDILLLFDGRAFKAHWIETAKYRSPDVRVHMVGVEFSSASRNVVAFEHAVA